MALSSNKATDQPSKKWVRILIPDSKLEMVSTNKETGKTSFAFHLADETACSGVFYASARQLYRNKERTGFVVSLPEEPVTVYISKNVGGVWGTKKETADNIAELGYPIAE